MPQVIPSILSDSPDEARALLEMCDSVVSRTHIDIIDGEFSANKTVTPEAFEDELYSTKLDFHLMVREPILWVTRCARANADRIIGQVELMEDQKAFCDEVLSGGCLVGLAIDLDTDISAIDESVFTILDVITVMSVQAGFGGQTFDKRALEKIEKLDYLRREGDYHFSISDDGGVTTENVLKVVSEGSDEVVIGRRLFHGDLSQNIQNFTRVLSRK